jgi:hypothetical protein
MATRRTISDLAPADPKGRGHREPQVPGFRIRAQRGSKHQSDASVTSDQILRRGRVGPHFEPRLRPE